MLSLFPLVSSHWLTVTVVITEPYLSPFLLLFAAVWSCHTGDGTRLRHTRRTSVVTTHESRHHATITSLLGRSCDMITIRYGWDMGSDMAMCWISDHACCYCRALLWPGTWVDDLFFTITLTVVLPVTISRFVSQPRLWLLLPIAWWHYIIHRQCAASSQLKLKIKLVQLLQSSVIGQM